MAINVPAKRPIRRGDHEKMMEDGDSLALEAVAKFLGDQAVSLEHLRIGLSGGRVYRCWTSRGQFALKQWPIGTTAERVDEVHTVQEFAGRSLAVVPKLVPHLAGALRLSLPAGTHFELSSWMPGDPFINPLIGSSSPREQCVSDESVATKGVLDAVSRGAQAIARFHRATLALGCSESVAPAVLRRLERLSQLKAVLPRVVSQAQRRHGAVGTAARFLAKQASQLFSQSDAILRPWLSRSVGLQWVLRDVHREHILFEDGRVSGIVDFDAVRRDTRATDLARWVGSFAELGTDLHVLWDAALNGYRCEQAISACEQTLASDIERASWCIHLANWVVWSSHSPQEIPGESDAADRRVGWLLRRSGLRLQDGGIMLES